MATEKSTAKEQEPNLPGGETEEPDPEKYIPKDKYEELLLEATTAKEKAELLDQLLEDPEFQMFIDKKESPTKVAPTPLVRPTATKTDIVAQLEKVIEPLRKDMEAMKSVYQEDQEKSWALEADRQISVMSGNKDDFPFFEEVQVEMAKLLETGRASSMVDAYRIAAFDKAEASGRNKVLTKREIRPTLLPPAAPSKKGDRGSSSLKGEKRSLRDIIGDAFDKHGVELPESEEED